MSSRTPGYYVGRPVESMQHMLRVLAQLDGRLQPVIADGVFGNGTVAAVMAFQRVYGLPITGQMDRKSWERLVFVYEKERADQRPAEPLALYLNPGQKILAGETNQYVSLIQVVLRTLSWAYGGVNPISVTGVMDGPTVAAVRNFQRISGLRDTGNVDKETWRYLARHYTMAAGNGKNFN